VFLHVLHLVENISDKTLCLFCPRSTVRIEMPVLRGVFFNLSFETHFTPVKISTPRLRAAAQKEALKGQKMRRPGNEPSVELQEMMQVASRSACQRYTVFKREIPDAG
jgi:hypothetical protein